MNTKVFEIREFCEDWEFWDISLSHCSQSSQSSQKLPSIGPITRHRRPAPRYAMIMRHAPELLLNSVSAQTRASMRSGLDWFISGL